LVLEVFWGQGKDRDGSSSQINIIRWASDKGGHSTSLEHQLLMNSSEYLEEASESKW